MSNRTYVVGVGMTKFEKPGSRDWDYPDMARESGTKALEDAGLDYREIEQVYVAAAHRGGGVADALMADAEARIRSAGHAQAWLAAGSGDPAQGSLHSQHREDSRRRAARQQFLRLVAVASRGRWAHPRRIRTHRHRPRPRGAAVGRLQVPIALICIASPWQSPAAD